MYNNNFFRNAPIGEIDTIDRYQSLGLRDNPFPSKPGVRVNSEDIRSNGTIYEPSVRETEQAEFEQIFLPGPRNPHAKTCAFVMDYATSSGRGIGKTAFLNYQTRRVNEDWGQSATEGQSLIFAVRIQPVAETRKFWEFAKLIAKALVDEYVLAKAMWRIRYFHQALPNEVRLKVTDPETTIGSDTWLRAQGVEPLYFAEHIRDDLEKIGIPSEVAKKLAYFGNDHGRFNETFMDVETDFFWRKHGNEFVFEWLVKIFRYAGISNGLLLVDEVEKIVLYQNKSERRSFVESLRYCFFDGEHENTKYSFFRILLTIHPYVQELLLPHWEASGLDRFAALSRELSKNFTIYFNPIENAMAVAMTSKYLERFQLPDTIPANQHLHPFDEAAIIEATRLTKGVPGKLLTFLHEMIEHAVGKGETFVSAAFIREFATTPTRKAHEGEDDQVPEPLKNPLADLKGSGLAPKRGVSE